jgi:hypothetical protein
VTRLAKIEKNVDKLWDIVGDIVESLELLQKQLTHHHDLLKILSGVEINKEQEE